MSKTTRRSLAILATIAICYGFAQILGMFAPASAQEGPAPNQYRYTTNPITALTIYFQKAYFTNIAANITVAIANPTANCFETAMMWITNSSGSDFSVTFPNGVWGTPGSGTPPVYWCTNKMLTRIAIEHYGQMGTNAYKLDFAP